MEPTLRLEMVTVTPVCSSKLSNDQSYEDTALTTNLGMSTPLDSSIVAQAVAALSKFEEKRQADAGKQSLVGYYAKPFLAQILLKEALKKGTIRPVAVKIPHSLFNADTEDHTVCLFCRSEDKKAIEDYIAEKPIEGLTKIISVNDVRKLFSAFKDRKKLLSEHTHFLCDSNIMSQLYNLLGKTFADRKNSPIPIIYKSPEKLEGAILKACSCTYIHLKGQVISVRIGLTSMSQENVISNGLQGIQNAVAKFEGEWNDIQSIHLMLPNTPALPIYKIQPSTVQSVASKKGAATKKSVTVATDTVPAIKGKKGKATTVVATPVVVPAVVHEEEAVATATSTNTVPTVKGKKGKATTAVTTPAVVHEEEAITIATSTKKAVKKAAKKEAAENVTSTIEKPAAIIVPVIAAPAVVAAATPSTPGKKRARPVSVVEISSPAVVAAQEPASKVKKSAKKAAKKD